MSGTAGRDHASSLREGRARILGATPAELSASRMRQALQELYERELSLMAAESGIRPRSGFALVALGGLGRREVLPHSDLDLVLVHERRPDRDLAAIADSLWYPLWDSGIGLDHSVRTVDQCLAVAASDVCAGLSLLDARVVAGDADLGALVVDGARRQWRHQIASRFDEVVAAAASRRHRAGVIAHLTEPDLKNGAGGLRDVQLVAALSLAQLCYGRSSRPGQLEAAHARVLDARTELHRAAGRAREVLHAEYSDEVGHALGMGDRFGLTRVLGETARTIAFTTDQAIRDSCSALSTRGLTGLLRRSPVRRPLADGVVEHAGEVALARGARVEDDPWLVVRVAGAAARSGLPIATATLGVLGERCPRPQGRWPAVALSDFLVLVGAGESTSPVIEALDHYGLWQRLVPEWEEIRNLPARDRAHVHPVDRHLIRTVVEAARLTTTVRRADLLLFAALVHDLGKGRPGDHCVTGAQMVRPVAERMGFDDDDVATLTRIVRHHLEFARTSTRKDPGDPATVASLLRTLGDDAVALEVLAALTEADSIATGPAVWTPGRAAAHAALVEACRATPSCRPAVVRAPTVDASRPHGRPDVVVDLRPLGAGTRHEVTLVVPGGGRSLEVAAQVLAFHTLEVVDAKVDLRRRGGMRARMVVATGYGEPADPRLLAQDLRRAVDGGLPAAMRRALCTESGDPDIHSRVSVLVSPRTDAQGVILEVRARDHPGLLASIVSAILGAGAAIDWARVRTRGSAVEDVFALSGPGAVPGTAAVVEAVLQDRGAADAS